MLTMPTHASDIAALRRRLSVLEGGVGAAHGVTPLGHGAIDAALGGGLARGALHEVFAAGADAGPAAGFAIALALRAAGERPVLWVRQDFSGAEAGGLYAPGLFEMGLAPERLILVQAHDGRAVLRAAEEGARCAPLGAVLIEPWGEPRALDLTATRRLALAAETSGALLIMLRMAASPAPSAAATRWEVRAAPSAPLAANAPGYPSFAVTLARRRAGAGEKTWLVEWDRDRREFRTPGAASAASTGTPLSGGVVPVPADGPSEAAMPEISGSGARRRAV
jgi:protein ImuA